MTKQPEPAAPRAPADGLAEMAEFLDFGPPLRIKPGAVEAAIAKARRDRSQAIHDMIGALWRHGPRHHRDAAVHA